MNEVLRCVLALGAAALNIVFWMLVLRKEPRFRSWVSRRYGVVITTGPRGHWSVSGSGSHIRDFGLELLHLGYFMAAFSVWAAGILVTVALMSAVGV